MSRILVVEDDARARKNISSFLGENGYEMDEANDGVEALDKLNHRRFDLVLADIVLPRMDGLTLIEHVCSSWPQTHIIAMTAYFQSAVETQFLLPGAEDFIRKPIALTDLLSKIQRLLKPTDSPAES
jgi:CheY-like chemotaxis protein